MYICIYKGTNDVSGMFESKQGAGHHLLQFVPIHPTLILFVL